MEGTALIVVAAAIFLWGAVSARLERADLTAPIVFTLVGAALAGLGLVSAGSAPEHLKPLVEIDAGLGAVLRRGTGPRPRPAPRPRAGCCDCSASACR